MGPMLKSVPSFMIFHSLIIGLSFLFSFSAEAESGHRDDAAVERMAETTRSIKSRFETIAEELAERVAQVKNSNADILAKQKISDMTYHLDKQKIVDAIRRFTVAEQPALEVRAALQNLMRAAEAMTSGAPSKQIAVTEAFDRTLAAIEKLPGVLEQATSANKNPKEIAMTEFRSSYMSNQPRKELLRSSKSIEVRYRSADRVISRHTASLAQAGLGNDLKHLAKTMKNSKRAPTGSAGI